MPLVSRKRTWSSDDDERLRAHIAKGGSAYRASVILRTRAQQRAEDPQKRP
jgi:hypothetical protein